MNKKLNISTNVFNFALTLISMIIATYILINNKVPWGWICTYWVTLPIKDYIDWAKPRIGD